jgi:hypothetical protein
MALVMSEDDDRAGDVAVLIVVALIALGILWGVIA